MVNGEGDQSTGMTQWISGGTLVDGTVSDLTVAELSRSRMSSN